LKEYETKNIDDVVERSSMKTKITVKPIRSTMMMWSVSNAEKRRVRNVQMMKGVSCT